MGITLKFNRDSPLSQTELLFICPFLSMRIHYGVGKSLYVCHKKTFCLHYFMGTIHRCVLLLQQVSHGAIQFTVYEELRKVIANSRSKGTRVDAQSSGELLVQIFGLSLLH